MDMIDKINRREAHDGTDGTDTAHGYGTVNSGGDGVTENVCS